MYYVFTFKSRTNAMKFYDALYREGIAASLINTPRSAGIGCGLSVKVSDYQSARRALSEGLSSYPHFHAVFRAQSENGYIRLVRI